MSTQIKLEAESRELQGKGASRRLRRLENKIPAIVYGGDKKPQLIHLSHFKVQKAFENQAIYSSILALHLNGKDEQVILKDLQRHPYKPVILHMDFQRVSAKDVLTRMVPLHFLNGEASPGHQEGGVVNHVMSQVEIRCEARYLPEYIEIDLINMKLDEALHLSDIKLPKQVELTADISDPAHNHPVVSIHISKSALSEEAQEAAEEEAAAAAAAEIVEEEQAAPAEAPAAEVADDTSTEDASSEDKE